MKIIPHSLLPFMFSTYTTFCLINKIWVAAPLSLTSYKLSEYCATTGSYNWIHLEWFPKPKNYERKQRAFFLEIWQSILFLFKPWITSVSFYCPWLDYGNEGSTDFCIWNQDSSNLPDLPVQPWRNEFQVSPRQAVARAPTCGLGTMMRSPSPVHFSIERMHPSLISKPMHCSLVFSNITLVFILGKAIQ